VELVSNASFSGECIVSAADEQVSCAMEGGQVILNLANGVYYELDGVGARIWELLQEPRSVSALQEAIVAEYEVDAAECEQDLQELLADLASHGLIRTGDATAP